VLRVIARQEITMKKETLSESAGIDITESIVRRPSLKVRRRRLISHQ
jgi:hypothetical protein